MQISEETKQISRLIYTTCMNTLKYTLEIEEMAFREKGREDPRYKTFKKHIMARTYDNLRELFSQLRELGLLEPTNYDEDVQGGYRDTPSGGSGFVNTKNIDNFLNS